MPGDRVASIAESPTQHDNKDNESHGWLTENVLNPFINGTGVRQVADTFTGSEYKPLHEGESKSFTASAAQTVSSVVGSIAPYILLGKVAHRGMGAFAEAREMTGMSKMLMRSESVANVAAAGAYEFLKKPTDGQTRVGNTAGTMLSFSAFEAGNYGLSKATPLVKSNVGRIALIGASRAVIGAAGGEIQYDVSNLVAGHTGGENKATNEGRVQAMVSGAVMNEALPLVHTAAGKAINLAVGSLRSPVPESAKVTLNLSGKSELAKSGDAPAAPNAPTTAVESTSANRPAKSSLAQILSGAKNVSRALVLGGETPELGHAFNSYEPIGDNAAKPEGTGAGDGKKSTTADALPHVELTEGVKAGETSDKISAKDGTENKSNGDVKSDRNIVATDKAHFGSPERLGATFTPDGINFAVNGPEATKVELVLYDSPDAAKPSAILPMNRTGDTWHRLDKLPEFTAYQFRTEGTRAVDGPGEKMSHTALLLDPEARAVFRAPDSMVNDARAIALRPDTFDWQNVQKPGTSMHDTVIYEMNVRGFTAGDDSLGSLKGTYRGLIQKIPYLKELGVTAIELLPVMEFQKDMKIDPETGKLLLNAWGYNTVGFKAVEGRYAHDGTTGQQVNEFKEMVRELHRNEIEVIMDVVFNHTGEGGADGKTINFRGLNEKQMYMMDQDGRYIDHTGCGNTVNANDPVVQDFIIKSLRYWVEEMQVDGFRFDLAKALKYMPDGSFNDTAPLIEAIRTDPVLSQVKLIAEPWDMSGYGPGRFAKGWAEWNGKFRDVVRRFVKGLTGQVKDLGDLIAGSSNQGFNPDEGQLPLNFVTAHDGFTLEDLVSFERKHNESNGEQNRDGNSDNDSRNYGVEGPVPKDSPIDILRVRQIKNMMSWLFFSEGTPMMLSGDEMRRTQKGNNNAYNQDDLNEVDWKLLQENKGVFNFAKTAIALRQALKIGHMRPEDIIWHGVAPLHPDWSDGSRFIARQFKAVGDSNHTIYMASNSWEGPIDIKLPPGEWSRVVDTNLPEGSDIRPLGQGDKMDSDHYSIMPYTTVAFVQAVPPGTARPIRTPRVRVLDARGQNQLNLNKLTITGDGQ